MLSSGRRCFLTALLSCSIAGCSTQQSESTSTDGDEGDMDSNNNTLQAPLLGLVAAENRSVYADRQNLQYDDGKVVVEAWLTGNVSTVDYPDEKFNPVLYAEGNQVIGKVDVDELQALAENGSIKNLSPRIQPQPT